MKKKTENTGLVLESKTTKTASNEKLNESLENIDTSRCVQSAPFALSDSPNKRKSPLDVMKDADPKIYVENLRLAMYIDATVKQAIRALEITRPRHIIQDLVDRYEEARKEWLKNKRRSTEKPKF